MLSTLARHPGHLQGIGLAGDRAGELSRQLHIGVLQHARGKVDNLTVEGFHLGARFVRRIGHRNETETRRKEVVASEVGEHDPLHAQHQDLVLVSTAARSLDNGFRGSREKIGRGRDFDGRIAG